MTAAKLDRYQALFAATGIGLEVVLVAYFALREWAFDTAMQVGWLYLVLAVPALVVSVVLYRAGRSPRLWAAGVVMAAWATYGFVIDVVSGIEWRSPINWPIFVPYLALYLLAQMWYWWPLLKMRLGLWVVYGVLYGASTFLNAISHQ